MREQEKRTISLTFEEDDVYTAMRYLRNLSTGRNPVDGSELPDDVPALDEAVSGSLELAADLLEGYLENGGFNRVLPARVRPFQITKGQRESIPISKKAVGVMAIANRITSVLPYDMERVSYAVISMWLESIGALSMQTMPDGTRMRTATALGEELGIRIAEKNGPRGPYRKNLYNQHAQQFVVDNLEGIMAFSGKNPSGASEGADDGE